MRQLLHAVLCAAALAVSACAAPAPMPKPSTLLLADGGAAVLPIVVAQNASEGSRAVAEELALYLGQMTGARFEVAAGDAARGIVLGTIAEFPQPERDDIARALEIRNIYDGKEAFIIRTEPERLLLLGATERGVPHAAFRLLEELGCRWLFPAKEWEVVPSIPTLKVSLNVDDRPAILARRIWYGFGFFDRAQGKSIADYKAWARHNRMAGSFSLYCGHAWQAVIARNKKVFAEHPEYLALHTFKDEKTGETRQERGGNKFCVSNPAVAELCKEFALSYFERNPDADMVSMEPSDGVGHCECAECAKMGKVSNRVVYLTNEVAKAVAEKYPGKMVGQLAYSEHSEPPEFELEPNVYIQLTAGFIRGQYTYAELLDLWPKRAPNMGYYEYFSVYLWDWDMLPGGAGANVPHLRKKIPEHAARGATSLDAESGNNWGVHGRGYYLANKLMWDPKADPDAILEDFYQKAFGPAAEAMKRYYERVDPGNEPLMSEHLLGLAFRDVEEAARLAADRPDVLARLRHIKIYLRYVHLYWMLGATKDKAEKRRLKEEIYTHVYRTRYTYMNHWEAIRQYSIRKDAEKYAEASWTTAQAPWADKPPYTDEQIEALFKEGLERFQPQAVEQKEFSQDLVPVRFIPPRDGMNTDPGMFQGGLKYALYSIKGEPVEVTVTTGVIAWYRNRAAASYKFLDAREKVIAEGRLPLDGEKHTLTAKVPGPGLYFFDFTDSSAGWRAEAPRETPLTIPLRRGRRFGHHGWGQDMCFYVPKGTRKIQYYWRGGAHRVLGPDGKLVAEVKDSGKFITIPVPEGMDGGLWRFSRFSLVHLWFFNVPNYVSGSPNALLLPREVVERDGLEIRSE